MIAAPAAILLFPHTLYTAPIKLNAKLVYERDIHKHICTHTHHTRNAKRMEFTRQTSNVVRTHAHTHTYNNAQYRSSAASGTVCACHCVRAFLCIFFLFCRYDESMYVLVNIHTHG